MTIHRRNLLKLVGLMPTTAVLPGAVRAQSQFPNQAVKMVVPFPPGGITDVTARGIGSALQAKWNQPVVVDNRSGAGGWIGAESVARSAPDGHTLLLGISAMFVASMIDKEVRYSLLRDFEPVTLIASTPLVLVVPTSLGVSKVSELRAALKREPSKSAYGSTGTGSSLHLYGHQLSRRLDLGAVEVPYRGSAPILTELVGGRLGYAFIDIQGAMPLIQGGQLKAVAVIGTQRSGVLPSVPSLAEEGVEGFGSRSWYGLYTTKGTPTRVLDRLSADLGEAIRRKEVSEKLTAGGSDPAPMTPQEFRAFMSAQVKDWTALAADAGMTVR